MAMTTMSVESTSSLYFFIPFSLGSQGQEAFWSSTLTSLRNDCLDPSMDGKEHVRRDLNPQQAVLETAALPIELLTYCLVAEKRGADDWHPLRANFSKRTTSARRRCRKYGPH